MESEEKPETPGCCPYCSAPFEEIKECHPFSSGAGAYYACDACGERLELYEYEELQDEIETAEEE